MSKKLYPNNYSLESVEQKVEELLKGPVLVAIMMFILDGENRELSLDCVENDLEERVQRVADKILPILLKATKKEAKKIIKEFMDG